MRILILGGNGMLAHQLFLHFKQKHEVKVTLRNDIASYQKHGLFNADNAFFNIDIRNFSQLENAIVSFKPEVVINGVGITHHGRETDAIGSLEVNALLPHRVALVCSKIGARFIQISTDCVFAGNRGHYREEDQPDAQNLYGRTKLLGEVQSQHCLTLRTSIIGLEIDHKHSLIEWFLAQKGSIKGFDAAIFSGMSTVELSRVIEQLLEPKFKTMHGVWHVSSTPISKYELLTLLNKKIHHDVVIERDQSFKCDRSLDSSRFMKYTGLHVANWEFMINELAESIIQREKRHE